MSTLEVKIVKVEILPHDNAEKLELCRIGGEGGYICVVGKGQFKTGDLAIYVPSDSVIPDRMVAKISETSKIKLDNRIRAVKIRGIFSEGLCLKPSEWLLGDPKFQKEGDDVTLLLGITKYEPPPPSSHGGIKSGKGINFNYVNPNFPEYWCVEHLKKYPKALTESDQVAATIKFHGTNFRAGIVRRPKPKGLWEKIVRALFDRSEFEYLVGSHEKIKKLSTNAIKYGAREIDTYWRAADKYKLEEVTKRIAEIWSKDPTEVIIYAEIIGYKIQTGYDYGIKEGDLEIRVFDIMVNKKYQDWDTVVHLCKSFNLPTVQEVYRGPYYQNIREHARAVDEYNGKKYVREGIVIRPLQEKKDLHCGRVIFKFLNEAYVLDKKNSEYH